MLQLARQFRTSSHDAHKARHEELRRQHQQLHEQRLERERRERLEDNAEQEMLDAAISVTLATTAEIDAFHLKIDSYDEATVRALMLNEEALEAIRSQLNDLLARAFVLEDGRRVFKTEDGTRVFDEGGQQLDAGAIDPESIPDHHPKWEEYKPVFEEEKSLTAERKQIIRFQDKLDEARECSSQEGLTSDELSELERELDAAMPDTIALQMPSHATENHIGLQPTNRTLKNFAPRELLTTAQYAP